LIASAQAPIGNVFGASRFFLAHRFDAGFPYLSVVLYRTVTFGILCPGGLEKKEHKQHHPYQFDRKP
jgi:hypothetical protein